MFHPYARHCHGRRHFMASPDGEGGRGRHGGPFGRHRGGPFGGRGPRVFDAGALRLVVLGLIEAGPRHGYDIIKALEDRFQGAYSPSPGAIYPMLQMLEEADLVSSATEGNKRLYTITEAGSAYLGENRAELDRINAQITEAAGQMGGAAVGEALHAFRHALREKLRQGALTAAQAEKLRQVLDQARRDVEGL